MTPMTEGSGGGEKGPDSRHAVDTEPLVFTDTQAGTERKGKGTLMFCMYTVIFIKVFIERELTRNVMLAEVYTIAIRHLHKAAVTVASAATM